MAKERKLTKLDEKVVRFLRAECKRLKVAHSAMVRIRKSPKSVEDLRHAEKSIIEIEAQYHLMATVSDVVVDMLMTGG